MADLTLKSQYVRASSLAQSGHHQEALGVARRILEAFPKYVGAYAILGQIHLEMGRPLEAAQLFRRVLSADPEHVMAYGSLGMIFEAQGLLDEALWQLYRAVEIDPYQQGYRNILRRVARSQGLSAQRIKMTRGGLARAYLRGQWLARGIAEIRSVLDDEPYRLDLQIALAEALWHAGETTASAEVCESLLVDLPHCLKANLILGQVWLNTAYEEEARECFQRAQALDPDNTVAQELFGMASPLPPRASRLPVRDGDFKEQEIMLFGDDEEQPLMIEGQAHLQEPNWLLPPPRIESIADGRPNASWETQRQYVEQNPQDHEARLALARRMRDMGMLAQALYHYNALVETNPVALADIVHDLALLTRLYSGHEGLRELIERAQRKLQSPDKA